MAISPSPFDRIQKSRRGRPGARLWQVLLVAALVAVAVLLRVPLSGVFWRVMEPVARIRQAAGQGEAAQLRAELASTTAALADRDALYKEVADLRARLGRDDVGGPRILAAILQGPPFSAYDTLVIDAGSDQGVRAGQLVSAGGSAIIGHVTEAYPTAARVELYSAPGQSYQALLNGVTPVAVEGQGGGSLSAQVPAGTPVKPGDSVAFPGLLGGIVAQVSAVEEKEGESFMTVFMRLPVSPSDLSRVEVLTQ